MPRQPQVQPATQPTTAASGRHSSAWSITSRRTWPLVWECTISSPPMSVPSCKMPSAVEPSR
ncbi:hypothetical protein [Blastococcus brunescens]|uniref:Uncharacterized protein n=1 Tax=Blastococcus brunescens TaxID=1564165 RepID=A0ABZ1B961_9ACTN|nr:hypothetical protein [Blastococcus sp. BMG 8361]WRL65914.1 hypothetical protein U6N30_10380 [Blastococcus sp. BMG 8361]